jgi:peptide-methionine (R)-S-oxide reductase
MSVKLARLLGVGPKNTPERGHPDMTHAVEKTDEEWRDELSPEEYNVLRQAGTERAFTGKLLEEHRTGVYRCRACDHELFRSDTKFESHCGWPSFYDPKDSDAVERLEDITFGMKRVEVRCKNCGSHLGHVFEDAPQTPTGDRYCMNSISLTFEPAAE